MRAALSSPAFRIAVLAITLAFGFLCARGLWDPDEGRYTNVALHMLDSGDWVHPHRSPDVGHWTKPPLTYWAVAASLGALGRTAWAARVPAALSYLLCVWLVWRMARRLAPGGEATAAAAFATMLWPVAAAQMVTTDFLVTAWQGIAIWAFVEARFGDPRHAGRWSALLWAAYGLAFLTKGPPALLSLLALVAFALLTRRRGDARVLLQPTLLLCPAIAAPWFLKVIHDQPALLGYFIGREVVDRVATDDFGRNGEWYGWLEIYLPTLLLGSLPWTLSLLRWVRALPSRLRAWRTRDARAGDAAALLPALWLLLPLIVFCVARSRLPLYILPLFLPLALLVAQMRLQRGQPFPAWRNIALWAALVLAGKFALGQVQYEEDARLWAQAIRERAGAAPVRDVIFVEDVARYGLHLELGSPVERVSLKPLPVPQPIGTAYDRDFAQALAAPRLDALWIAKTKYWPQVRDQATAAGLQVDTVGTPYRGRVFFRMTPAATR